MGMLSPSTRHPSSPGQQMSPARPMLAHPVLHAAERGFGVVLSPKKSFVMRGNDYL